MLLNHLVYCSTVGMEVQGIYRMSGTRDDIYTIKADFDSGIQLQESLFHTYRAVCDYQIWGLYVLVNQMC